MVGTPGKALERWIELAGSARYAGILPGGGGMSGDTIVISVTTETGAITCTTAPTRPWDLVRVAQVLLDTALDMADQQPGKPWDEAGDISEKLTDLCLDEDNRAEEDDA